MGNKLCNFNTIENENITTYPILFKEKEDSFFGETINPNLEKERLEDLGKYKTVIPNEINTLESIKTKNYILNSSIKSNNEEEYIKMKIIENNINKINRVIRKYLLNKREKLFLRKNNKIGIEKRINLNIIKTSELKYKYIGNIFNNQKEGLGIKKFSDKSIIIGIYLHNLSNGYGKYNFINGNFFRGEFENDKINGYGIFNFTSLGLIFEGLWKNNIQNEIGIEKWANNSYYKGEYFNGKKNGFGVYKWENGNYYFGEWKNNFLFGFGIYKMKNKKYQGQFFMNYISGYGEMIYENNNLYFGFWKNNKNCGFGIEFLVQKNIIFLGFWKENFKCGYGKLMYKNNTDDKVNYGFWKDNQLNKIFEQEKFYQLLINIGFERYINIFNKEYNDIEKIGLYILNSL